MSGLELRERRADNFKSFFRSWMQNPLAIGAVAPSSRLLAKMMAMNLGAGDRVIELGAGTGTVTQAILDAGVRPEDLYVVEQNEEFVRVLKGRFRSSPVIEADAMKMADHLRGLAGSVDFIISGLPLLLFSAEQKIKLLSQAFHVLRPDGVLRQFTYAGRCPVGRDLRARLRIQSSLIGIAPFNLPPAFVYRFGRA
jgi:phosphatidylethanolamine/phosphatidyl-N-methylethanolamine N-methyltransferase